MWRDHLPDPTAAESVHAGEIVRRARVTGICRAPVPVRRRWAVRRHQALPRVETDPEVVHRSRQPCLGALSVPLHGVFVLHPRVVNISQRKHGVRVPLPRRLLQQCHALLRPGLAPPNTSLG
jgi:hypothetical protein